MLQLAQRLEAELGEVPAVAEGTFLDAPDTSGDADSLESAPLEALLSDALQMRARREDDLAQITARAEGAFPERSNAAGDDDLPHLASLEPAVSNGLEPVRKAEYPRTLLVESELL